MGEESFTEWSGTAIRIAQEGIAAAEYRGQDFDQEHLAWCRRVLGDHRRQIVYETAKKYAAVYDGGSGNVEALAEFHRTLLKLFGVDQRHQDLAAAIKQQREVFLAASEYAGAYAEGRPQGMIVAMRCVLAAFDLHPEKGDREFAAAVEGGPKPPTLQERADWRKENEAANQTLGTGTFSRMTANELNEVHARNQAAMFPEEEAPPKLFGEYTLKELMEMHPQYQMTEWERRTLDRVAKRKHGEVPTFPSDSGTWGKATDMSVESVMGTVPKGEYAPHLDSLSGKERADLTLNSWPVEEGPGQRHGALSPGGNGVTIKGKELYGKYIVTRTDGARVEGDRFFVLAPDTDLTAREVLSYYAELIERKGDPGFAAALRAHYQLPGAIPQPYREHVEEIKNLELRIDQLYSLAEKMIGMELGTRQEQIKALALAGIVVTEAEHIERAINCSNGFNRDLEAIMGRNV